MKPGVVDVQSTRNESLKESVIYTIDMNIFESRVVVKETQGHLGCSSRRRSRRDVDDLEQGGNHIQRTFRISVGHFTLHQQFNGEDSVQRGLAGSDLCCNYLHQTADFCTTDERLRDGNEQRTVTTGTRESKCGDRRARISTAAVVILLLRCDERQARC